MSESTKPIKKRIRMLRSTYDNLIGKYIPDVGKPEPQDHKLEKAIYRAACNELGHVDLDFSSNPIEILNEGCPKGLKKVPRGVLQHEKVIQPFLSLKAMQILSFMQVYYAKKFRVERPSIHVTLEYLMKAKVRKPSDYISRTPRWAVLCHINDITKDYTL